MLFSGVGTKIDPTLCRADRLVGQVLGAVGALPEIYTELEISYFLLRRLLGVRTEGDKKGAKVNGKIFFLPKVLTITLALHRVANLYSTLIMNILGFRFLGIDCKWFDGDRLPDSCM